MGSARAGWLFAAALALALGAACGADDDPQPGGVGAAGVGAGSSQGGGGSGNGGAGASTTGGGGAVPTGPHLSAPSVIALPYVVAGSGGSSVVATLANDGSEDFAGLSVVLEGDPSLSLEGSLSALPAGGSHELILDYTGAPTEEIVTGSLVVSFEGGGVSIPVHAVAGDPDLGVSSWEPVEGAGGVVVGEGATIAMPTAPYPDGGAPFTDDSVHLFLPEGYRERGAQALVVHFHGHGTTIAETLAAHRYREHVYASGTNAVLVVPQGPVETASGDFGKLMDPGGLDALLREVLVVLYRDERIDAPLLDRLVLTSHSGGYAAVAANLRAESLAPVPHAVHLFDSLYAEEPTYEAFVVEGGWLRSNYTSGGGTLDNNQWLAGSLVGQGVAVATTAAQRTLRDEPVVIYATDASHSGATRVDGAYGEQLRWDLPVTRRGPRIELREAVAQGATGEVRWLAPPDDDVTGWVVERSADGHDWTTAASVGPSADSASFALDTAARVRVRGLIANEPDTLPSDEVRIAPNPTLLVVDGFDRLLDGSFGGLHHDFAARVGEAAGAVATVSNEAVTEDGFALASWPIVLWLLGDESTADRALSAAELDKLVDYVDAGGMLILSGSEAAWALDPTPAGAYFLAHSCDAAFVADDAGTLTVTGRGPLASLATFGFGGPAAPYAEDYPDVLAPQGASVELLEYATSGAAALGLAGSCVLVGFPLELVDEPAVLAELVAGLLAFVSSA